MIITDPRKIQIGFPYVVLNNQNNSELSWIIDERTGMPGIPRASHAMSMIQPGQFATQGLTYEQVPVENYMVEGGQLWFIQVIDATPGFNAEYIKSVQDRLDLPFFLKSYDFLGIFGQAIGQTWIHTPFLDYCSVDVITHLKAGAPFLAPDACQFIQSIPNESNPEYLMYSFLAKPSIFKFIYYWDSTTGIIA